jgi:type IV pilus assembly protein PilA
MKKLQELRKSRKGFTLVEIIVVLVILAILAAFTIPAMLGFVNDARSKAQIAQAREVYVAAQSAATESAAGNAGKVDADKMINKTKELVSGDLTGFTYKATNGAYTATDPGASNVMIYYDETTAKVNGITFRGTANTGIGIHEGGTDVLTTK